MARRYANVSFGVFPRYTCGSGCALVSEGIARGVVRDEKEAYQYALEGATGQSDLEMAKTAGLRGIAEVTFERGDGWDVQDLITGEQFRREKLKPAKLRPGMLFVRGKTGERLTPLKRIAQIILGSYEATILFGSEEDQRALASRQKAPYELENVTVSKNEEVMVEYPLPEEKRLDFKL
jgi:hypothetical protein